MSKFLKSSALLTAGGIVTAACGFARNIIIARLISVEDFGIAATFAMTMSLIEMASNLALDKLVVQAPDGEDERLLATAHAFQVLRGCLSAVVLFASAGFVASLFGVPEVAWAFRFIAAVPLVRSLGHLDIARFQRVMRYRPLVLVEAAPQLIATAVAAPLALWLNDYRVMLYVVLIQVVITTMTSHLVADRPYRWAWDTSVIRRMLAFGWPLLLDGVLIFIAFHGEKILIGSVYSVEDLGWYSAALTLTMTPSLLAATVLSRLLLPKLSGHQSDVVEFARHYAISAHAHIVAGVVFAAGMIVGGGALVVLLYGAKYSAAYTVMPWLALAFGIRIIRNGQSLCAVAKGRTSIAMIANLVRASGIVLAVVFLVLDKSIEWIAASAFISELLSFVIVQGLIARLLGARIPGFSALVVLGAAVLAGSCGLHYFLISIEIEGVRAIAIASAVGAVAAAACVSLSGPLRDASGLGFLKFRVAASHPE